MPYVLDPGFHDQMVAWASAPLPAMAHVGGQMESQFDRVIGRAILGRIWLGETARQIGADPAMPCYATIYHWRRVHEGFRADWDDMRALKAELLRAERTRALASRPRKRDGGLGGPPSRYTPEMAAAICALIEDGLSMSQVLRARGVPSSQTVYNWLRARPEFAAMYARACQVRADRLSAEAEEIALDSTAMSFERDRARVARIEGRIGRLAPRTYRPSALEG